MTASPVTRSATIAPSARTQPFRCPALPAHEAHADDGTCPEPDGKASQRLMRAEVTGHYRGGQAQGQLHHSPAYSPSPPARTYGLLTRHVHARA